MVKRVILNRKGERLLKKGILTIYKDGVEDGGGAEPGEEIFVTDRAGHIIGGGFYDGYGPIAIRILYKGDLQALDEIIERNILLAYNKRKWYPFKSMRLVYADSDYLPGLIIDIYNNIAVIQSSSIGMDIRVNIIAKALKRHGIAESIYLKNTQRNRLDIGLELFSEWLTTEKEEETIIEEGKARFIVNVVHGQKTGFYLDHRLNRLELPKIYNAEYIIDLYSYTGGFGIQFLLNKGKRAFFVEENDYAVEILTKNIKINNLVNKTEIINEKVEKFLENNEMNTDILIVDPPALVPMKRSIKRGINKYREILNAIVRNIHFKAVFISSCSYHITEDILKSSIIDHIMRRNNIEYWYLGGVRKASPDHMARDIDVELDYLKAYLLLINKT